LILLAALAFWLVPHPAWTRPQGNDRAHRAGKRIGDAWSDPSNPVVQRFGGQRLDLWSLRKPVRPRVPETKIKHWPHNAIDRFILADLEKVGLTPSPEADRRTLIRRLFFDLLGLPPSPEEVQQFVSDRAADAYERLVDRLLANPHYGERWGRHWLDVVRYADGNGFERDEWKFSAWLYRDYVIAASNRDKPFDQFIREQLAGDELAGQDQKSTERLIATGYLRLGPYDSTAPLFVENAKGRDYLMSDLVSTTGSAFLGLTLACCQCHDHKYDPLLQADHFRLRAFFAALKFRDDPPVDLPYLQREIKLRNAALGTEIARVEKRRDPIRKRAEDRIRARSRLSLAAATTMLRQSFATLMQVSLIRNLAKVAIRETLVTSELTAEEKKQLEPLNTQVEELKAKERPLVSAMSVADAGAKAPPTHIFAQGDITRPLDEVQPGFLSVLDPNPARISPPASQVSTGRRTALASWIGSPDNPLTARVLVNRLWQQHFGRGIVATPNDLGYSGSRPTHPKLLDWLAVEFMGHGWSIKHIQRLILLSAAYRQVSTVDPQKQARDPDNRWLWRQNITRLEAETIRDAELAVSGKLRGEASGPPVWPHVPTEVLLANPVVLEPAKEMEGRLEGWYTDPVEQTDVRTIFTIQKRSITLPLLQVLDLPESSISCGRRTVSTVAPQALQLLNSPFAIRMARAFAERVAREAGADPERRVERAVWLALSRLPTADEKKLLVGMLGRHTQVHRGGASEQAALIDLCRALLNVNEFVYMD
jgi:hypothetical protein